MESGERRRAHRLVGYDYREAGAYVVTLCTVDRIPLFGEIFDGEMRANAVGMVVQETWLWLEEHFPYVELDAWVLMPNHVHGIIVIRDSMEIGEDRGTESTARAGERAIQGRETLGRLVGAFKTVSTKRINEMRATPGRAVWQRDFYDHIVRNDADLDRIRKYIVNNPHQWALDRENPDFLR